MPQVRSQAALYFANDDAGVSDTSIRLAIFDDHELMRKALTRALHAETVFEIVASGSSADAAVRAAEEDLPDIMLLDVSMPGGGINAAREICKIAPFVKCVMLSSTDDEDIVGAALSAGAYAFLAKGIALQHLADSLKRVHRGWSVISPGLASDLISGRGFGAPWTNTAAAAIELSEREEQILSRTAQGLTETEIAEGIGLSVQSVGAFLTNVLIKLHSQARVDIVLRSNA